MKVLYLGHFLENSSWSQVAIDNYKALSMYCDTAWRPVNINPKSNINLPNSDLKNITKCIQHVLPNFMQKTDIKSVGFFEQETNQINNIEWEEKLSFMDEVWVPNKFHLKDNYQLIRHCTDIKKYESKINTPIIPGSNFKFYTIAENNRRKRLAAIINAFHINFNQNDNVSLIIKSNGGEEGLRTLVEMNEKIKKTLNKINAVDPIFITNHLKESDIYNIHQSCNCFVSASYGEAWNLPMMDAMGFNNFIITSETVDYLDPETSISIKGQEEHCLGAEQYVEGLHSHHNTWNSISIYELGKHMRETYESNILVSNDMSFCSYETVGKAMYERMLKL